ncbi:hypothetical protein [Robbsia andropogonis]|uniref:hypothetical protein n=1 Tax=Robbsia andropogonis TaxID=28092 RepID=UPI00158BA611|nr:hypothetical protein [Robbsia andropogonis]
MVDVDLIPHTAGTGFCALSAQDIGLYLRSLSAFVSAQISCSRAYGGERMNALANLRQAAGGLQIDCVTGFTVEALGKRIRKSTRSSMIYEQYCANLVDAARHEMQALTPLAAEALWFYMELDVLVEDAKTVHEAVQEAYDAMYGEAEDFEWEDL